MNTIRENMKDLVKELLLEKGVTTEEQAYEWACGIADQLGLDGLEGDQIGRLACVILTTLKGVTRVASKPEGIPVVWIDEDSLSRNGADAVEVL